jgi:hypothetical protein
MRERHEDFTRRGPEDEFREYARRELERLRNTDAKFDEDLHRQAVALVLERLTTRQGARS